MQKVVYDGKESKMADKNKNTATLTTIRITVQIASGFFLTMHPLFLISAFINIFIFTLCIIINDLICPVHPFQ